MDGCASGRLDEPEDAPALQVCQARCSNPVILGPTLARSNRPLRVLFLTVFIDLVGFSIIFPLLPSMLRYYFEHEGSSSLLGRVVQITHGLAHSASADTDLLVTVLFGGLLGSVYSALQFFSAPLLGRLSDRVGRRPVLVATVAGNLLGYVLWFFSGSFVLLLLARVVNGVMGGNLSVASAAIADSTSAEDRTRGMALIGVAFGLGFIIGPAVGGLSAMVDLPYHLPWLATYGVNPFSMAALCAALLAGVNLLQVVFRLPETLPAPSGGAPRATLSEVMRGRREIRRTMLVNLATTLALSGLEFSLTFYAAERLGYGPTQNVYLFLFLGVVMVLTQGGLSRWLARRVEERRVATAGLLVELTGVVLLSLARGPVAVYSGLGLIGLGSGLVMPALSALVSLYATPQEQGRVAGGFRSTGSAARALGPLIAAVFYFRLGSGTAYLLAAVMLGLPLLLTLRLPRAVRLSSEPEPPPRSPPRRSASA